MTPSHLVLWVASIASELVLCWLIWRRKAQREYPAFAAWIALLCVRSLLLVLCNCLSLRHAYWWVFWTGKLVAMTLRGMVAVEIYRRVFAPFDAVPARSRTNMYNALGAIAAASIMAAILFPATVPDHTMRILRTMDRTLMWILCAAFYGAVALSRRHSIPWRHQALGIQLGMLCCHTFSTVFSTFKGLGYDLYVIDTAVYLVSVTIWVWYFATPDTPRLTPSTTELKDLQRLLRATAVGAAQATTHKDEPWQ